MTTEQQDKAMLAEFMEYGFGEKYDYSYCFCSYDQIMPVVEKIEGLDDEFYKVTIDGKCATIDYYIGSKGFYTRQHEKTKLESIFKACVKFVKWWNQQNADQQNKKEE